MSSSVTRVISVFGSAQIVPASEEYRRAKHLGRLLGEAGWVVATGGFDGAMEAACRGACEVGAHTVGVTVAEWNRAANPWVREEQPEGTFVDRLVRVATMADGYVAVDGGIGTLTEIALVWSLVEVRSLPPRPLVVIGERWQRVFQVLERELIARPEHLALVSVVETPEEAVQALRQALDVATSGA